MNHQLDPATFSTEYPSNAIQIIKLKTDVSNQCDTIKVVEINNCPTTLEASKLISNSIFRSILESLKNFAIIKLKINEKLNGDHAEKPKIHEFKTNKNFLISYESNVDKSQKIIYWKNGKDGRYLTMRLIEGYSVELSDFVRDFMIDICDRTVTANNLELIDLIDVNNCNLLMKAVDKGKSLELVNELLRLPFDINQTTSEGKTAADIAWEEKNFQILFQLLEANSTFPSDFNINELEADEAWEDIEELLTVSSNMRKAIRKNKIKKMKDLIKQKPNFRYFYNSSNVSAAVTALELGNYEAYNVLLENGCSNGPNENLIEINNTVLNENQVDEPTQKKIKFAISNAHSIAAKSLPEKHLMIHYANIVVAHDDQYVKQRVKYINNAYEILNEIPLIRQILKLTAKHKNFKIHFDFNRTSVEFMHPYGTSEGTEGLYNPTFQHIHVAAKELLDENLKFAAIGTLAHELCHFAMNLIFSNNCKPYAINDNENEGKFNEIIEEIEIRIEEHIDQCESNIQDINQHIKCEELRVNYGEIILCVYFCYKHSLWPAELIVRVPHMTAHHHNNSDRLKHLKVTLKDLFDYYDTVVTPKMTETINLLEKLYNNSIGINYDDLTHAYKSKIYHSNVEFQGKIVKLKEIVENNNSEIYQLLTSQQIREILLDGKLIKIGSAQKIDGRFYIEREFVDNDIDERMDYNSDLLMYEWRESVKENSKNFDQVSSFAETSELILLSDYAGAGKTTTFKHLSVKLKEKFPNYWVSYIDLKRHIKIYEKYEKNLNVFNILLEILAISDEFERKLFTNMLKSQKVILLFDGVDEIAPKFNAFLVKIIRILTNFTQQWISTRPQHVSEFDKSFELSIYKLLPFDDMKIFEFIKKVLISRGVNENTELLVQEIMEMINNSISRYNYVNNPLMLQISTELYLNDRSSLKISNLYSIYEQMLMTKKKELFEKGEIVNFDRDNENSNLTIWQVHQIFALKLHFSSGIIDLLDGGIKKFNYLLIKKWTNGENKNWTPDAISRYGFLSVDNWNTRDEFPDFVHRTFSEFFIAEFLIQKLFKNENDDNVKLTLKLLLSQQRAVSPLVLDFILSYLKENPKLKLNSRFFKLIISDKMSEYIKNNFEYEGTMKVLRILSTDVRFLKKFKVDNETIFQKYFRQYYTGVEFLIKIIDFYTKSLGDEWIRHIGYSMKNKNDKLKIDDVIDYVKITVDESAHNFEVVTAECVTFLKFLCVIDQVDIPKNEIKHILKISIDKIFRYSFKSRSCVQKLIKIFNTNFNDSKDELMKNLIEKISRAFGNKRLYQPKSPATDEYLSNINYFCEKIEEFLAPFDDLRHLQLKIFATYCSIKSFKSLYEKHAYCTKDEIHELLIKYSAHFIEEISELSSSDNLIINLENYLKETLENEIQLRRFLENRTEYSEYHYSNSVFSSINTKIHVAIKQNLSCEKFVKIQTILRKLAKEVELTYENIEKDIECCHRCKAYFDSKLTRL